MNEAVPAMQAILEQGKATGLEIQCSYLDRLVQTNFLNGLNISWDLTPQGGSYQGGWIWKEYKFYR